MGKKITLQDCINLARSNGGQFMSPEYVPNTSLLWRCENNHEWSTRYHNIKRGQWCAKCKGCVKLTLEECQEYAKNKGGECLSTIYIDTTFTKMKWRCENEWESRFNDIKRGHWCPYCVGDGDTPSTTIVRK
jgi:hypothetical protein